MYDYGAALAEGKQAARAISIHLRAQLTSFVAPLLQDLDAQIDRRLVRTFHAVLEVFLVFRHRQAGLLLSELGAYLLSPDRAPAGTKRLSNLLRSPKWKAELITSYLWRQAEVRLEGLQGAGAEALLLWDESVLEKAESLKLAGLGPVRSSKAARLHRPRPGCFRKPGPPVVVPGMHWLCLLLVGPSGPPTVARMQWFALPRRAKSQHPKAAPAAAAPEAVPTAGEVGRDNEEGARPDEEGEPEELPAPWVESLRAAQEALLQEAVQRFGRQVLHVWDRGYAGSPWLGRVLPTGIRFVLRWPKRFQLVDAQGQRRPAWQIARGKRAWGHQYLWDPRKREYRKTGVLAFPVRHPDYATPLWLVVGRAKGKAEPWYLLTTEPIHTASDAWKIVRAYARRWQIELGFRDSKSELALESPRLWTWEGREKLLLMGTLVYAFLLLLLHRPFKELRRWLLRYFCHRTGHRSQAAAAPLYRLRAALSHLWTTFPRASAPTQDSG
jgi:hypothetical protein